MSWYEDADGFQSGRAFGKKIQGNSRPSKPPLDDRGTSKASISKRKGKNGSQECLKATSKRRLDAAQKESMEDVFMRGHDDDVRRVCSSLENYDAGDSACRTAAGLLVKLPDEETGQMRMYQWCIDMGFQPADSTHPVMKLPVAMVPFLKIPVNKCKRDETSILYEMDTPGLSFLESSIKKPTSRRKTHKQKAERYKYKSFDTIQSQANKPSDDATLVGADSASVSKSADFGLIRSARLGGMVPTENTIGDLDRGTMRIQVSDMDNESVESSPRSLSTHSHGKRKSPRFSPSPDHDNDDDDGGADSVIKGIKSIAIYGSADNGKGVPADGHEGSECHGLQKRRRSDSPDGGLRRFASTLTRLNDHASTSVIDTPVLQFGCDGSGSSLLSPPSSDLHPPPVEFDANKPVRISRRKSCSELFENDSSTGTADHPYPSQGDGCTEAEHLACRNFPFLLLNPSIGSVLSSAGNLSCEPPSAGGIDYKRTESMSSFISRESDCSSRGHEIKRQVTEPLLHPRTPFRDVSKCISQDAVIFTPQAVLGAFLSSGKGTDEWGMSADANEDTLHSFRSLFERREKVKVAISHCLPQQKSNAKMRKKKALLRRMSHSRSMLFTPGASVCKKIKLPRSPPEQNSVGCDMDEWNLVDSICPAEGDELAEGAVMATGHAAMNELNFKGVVVGGVYENCFDDNVPVVSAPSSYDNRVVNVSCATDGTLFLHMYFPNTKSLKTVNVGINFFCYRTSTGAFLVTKTELLPHRRMVCYYLPKHPLRWATASSPKDIHDYSIGSIVTYDHDHLDDDYLGNRSIICASDVEDMESDSHSDVVGVDHEHICRVLESSMEMAAEGLRGDLPTPRENESCSSLGGFGQHEDSSFENGLVLPCERHIIADSDCSRDYSEVLECSLVDWNNPIVASCICEYLSGADCVTYSAVSKSWALAHFKFRAHYLSLPGYCDRLDRTRWVRFMSKYNTGAYLNRGACKTVYRVCNGRAASSAISATVFQAVSVMDIDDLIEREVGESISRELEISMVTSSLVSLNISPNFIQVYSVFESKYSPSCNLWKQSPSEPDDIGCKSTLSSRSFLSAVQREASSVSTGRFQYIRMELCEGGDMEGVLRARSTITADSIVNYFFQMCFSLYSCRERLSMRHYDIKLLNFFCTSAASLPVCDGSSDCMSDKSHMRIGFGDHEYYLPLHDCGSTDIVKLADFGTSVLGSNSLGCPIGIHQFTTLENTPPEYLMLGSHAREAFSADTFCLGLAFFHLLSGEEPYEEHLKNVRCPSYLQKRLSRIWMSKDASNPYCVIREVIESLDSGDEDPDMQDMIENVLYDTLYRYVVLFGFCETFSVSCDCSEEASYPYSSENPVWLAIVDSLGQKQCVGKNTKAKLDCIKQFELDRDMWSLDKGSHPTICRVRENLCHCGEASADILRSMVHLDPAQRCSLHDILSSRMFSGLRNIAINRPLCSIVSYMYYKTTCENESGFDTLPIL